MLTGTRVAFLGGDARQLEVIHKLIEMDATVTLMGFDNLQPSFIGAQIADLDQQVLSNIDALILPVMGIDDEGFVDTLFSIREWKLEERHFEMLPAHASVYTGISKKYLKEQCQAHHLKLVELLERDDIAIYNSIPTTEGAIMMAIQNTDFTLHGSNCIVLGLGRTGLTLARTLHGIGAKVSVGIRQDRDYARVLEMGLKPFYTKDLKEAVNQVDVLFNTVPSLIVDAQVIAQMPHTSVIIDLASKPGGTDFRFAEKRGIKALLAPGLPGIVAPKTAGQIIAGTLSQLLKEEKTKRSDLT